jgi:hypothetical protein
MFENLGASAISVEAGASDHAPFQVSFCVLDDPSRSNWLAIVPAHRQEPVQQDFVWQGEFEQQQVAQVIKARLAEDPGFLCLVGRLAYFAGPQVLDGIFGEIAAAVEQDWRRQEAQRREEEAARLTVHCYCRSSKNGHSLSLKRESDHEPGWEITFRGRAERERLADWMRWQKGRYLEFLDFAECNGARALEKRLLNEMFETEARIKAAGRSAGGQRPLRMWRGEE